MKYIIINKWQLKDTKEDIFYIVPFNEEALLLTKEVA